MINADQNKNILKFETAYNRNEAQLAMKGSGSAYTVTMIHSGVRATLIIRLISEFKPQVFELSFTAKNVAELDVLMSAGPLNTLISKNKPIYDNTAIVDDKYPTGVYADTIFIFFKPTDRTASLSDVEVHACLSAGKYF